MGQPFFLSGAFSANDLHNRKSAWVPGSCQGIKLFKLPLLIEDRLPRCIVNVREELKAEVLLGIDLREHVSILVDHITRCRGIALRPTQASNQDIALMEVHITRKGPFG